MNLKFCNILQINLQHIFAQVEFVSAKIHFGKTLKSGYLTRNDHISPREP